MGSRAAPKKQQSVILKGISENYFCHDENQITNVTEIA